MSATTPLSARRIAHRRRAAAWRRNWKLFRGHRAGLIGLAILGVFVVIALAAPLLADPEGLKVTKATGGVLESPSREFPLGTDENGRSVLTMLIWGTRISLFGIALPIESGRRSTSSGGR